MINKQIPHSNTCGNENVLKIKTTSLILKNVLNQVLIFLAKNNVFHCLHVCFEK